MQLMGNLLERKVVSEVKQLLIRIIVMTVAIELVGAILLSELWRDLPLADRVFYSAFHSISAFCNAGFSLHAASFEAHGHCWQVWGVTAGLIVLGGLDYVRSPLVRRAHRAGLGNPPAQEPLTGT